MWPIILPTYTGSALHSPTPPLLRHPIHSPYLQRLSELYTPAPASVSGHGCHTQNISPPASELLHSQASEMNLSISENSICSRNISLCYTERHSTQNESGRLRPPEAPSPLPERSGVVAGDAPGLLAQQAGRRTFIQASLTSRKTLINRYFYKLKKMLIPQGRMRLSLLK